jgi:hypothetical protein
MRERWKIMAKYRVEYAVDTYMSAIIEADSPEEAYRIAESMDGSEFTEDATSAECRYVGATDFKTGIMYDRNGNEM